MEWEISLKLLLALGASLQWVAEGRPSNEQVVFQTIAHNPKTSAEDPYKVRDELKKAEIIPTVIDEFLPLLSLDAEWSSNLDASLGNTLKPKKLQDAPTISLRNSTSSNTACNSGMTYVITLTDPDAPSHDNPKWSEMCHWIAYGATIASESQKECSEDSLTGLHDVIEYKPPGPPPKTGKHRYVFLAFAPANGTTDYLNLTKPVDRQHWGTGKERHGVRDWAKDNGLIPVAANFIYAQNKKQ